jgi:ribokinase
MSPSFAAESRKLDTAGGLGRVVVVGSINHDLVLTVRRAPAAGETVCGESLVWFPGGKGANQAVAAARCAVRTVLVGRLGADDSGRTLHAYLESQGLQLEVAQDPRASTGTAVILVDERGENRIIVVPGANAHVSAEETAVLDSLTAGDIVLVQNEIDYVATYQTLVRAKAHRATTIFNCAPARVLQDDILAHVDYLVVNEVEYEAAFGEALAADAERQLAQRRTAIRCNLIVTLGSRGVIASLHVGWISCSGHRVRVVDTTGAGDCFVGAFAAALLRTGDCRQALPFANAAAALSVERRGASCSFPTYDEVEQLLREDHHENQPQ